MRVTSDVGPFSITPEWVLDAEISDRAVRLYAVLGRYANGNGESFPSRQTLAKRLGCSESSAIRASRELVIVGALRITHRADANGDSETNLYHLIYASPQTGGGVTSDRGGGSTRDTQNESHLERETSIAAAPQKKTNRQHPQWDPVWDALAYVFGIATTAGAKSKRAKVCAALVDAGAKADQVIARASAWPQHFDSAALTDTALEKHWDTLGRKPLRRR